MFNVLGNVLNTVVSTAKLPVSVVTDLAQPIVDPQKKTQTNNRSHTEQNLKEISRNSSRIIEDI